MPFTITSRFKLSSKRRTASPVSSEPPTSTFPVEPPTPAEPSPIQSDSNGTDRDRIFKLEGAASRAAEIGWEGAKLLLYLLRDSADAFPPLKSVAGGIVALVEIGERTRSVSDGVMMATERLDRVMGILAKRLQYESSSSFSNEPYVSVLLTELNKLEPMNHKGFLARVAQSKELAKQLSDTYNTITDALQELSIDIGLSVERDTRALLQESVLQNLGRAKSGAYTAAVAPSHEPRRSCTPGTRVDLVDSIVKWALGDDTIGWDIYWISGLAGQGKSTVAYTVCERLGNMKRGNPTVISLFCSRQLDSHEEKLLVSTLAFELAEASASYASELLYTLQVKHNLGDQRLSVQMSQLLIGPWERSVDARRGLPPIILVIDAIDENDAGMEFVYRLVSAKAENKLLGLRVLFTSRPDPAFDSELWRSVHGYYHHDLNSVDQYRAMSEIGTYLRAELSEYCEGPFDRQLYDLARASAGLFIYAATIVRLVKPKGGRRTRSEQASKLRRLVEDARNFEVDPSTSSGTRTTVTILDDLYAGILQDMQSDLDDEEITARLHVLMTMVCTSQVLTVSLLATLAGVDEELVDAVVQALSAVLYMDADKHVLLCHVSFHDFILGKYKEFIPLTRKRVFDRCQELISTFAESGAGGSMASTSAPVLSSTSNPTKAQVDAELLRARIALMETERVVRATHAQMGSSTTDTD